MDTAAALIALILADIGIGAIGLGLAVKALMEARKFNRATDELDARLTGLHATVTKMFYH